MSDEELLQLANGADHAAIEAGRDRPILYGPYQQPALRAIAADARAEEREACAMICDVKAQSYDAIVDGMGQSRQAVTLRGAANAIRSRSAAGEQGRGGDR